MSGFLTTHILDTAAGTPAKGIEIDLYRLEGETRTKLNSTVTNDDGRTDSPILPKEKFLTGNYELVFKVGAYLQSRTSHQSVLADPLFLDEVPIRFGMAEDKHYHVPLLLSPFGYSTYRGS